MSGNRHSRSGSHHQSPIVVNPPTTTYVDGSDDPAYNRWALEPESARKVVVLSKGVRFSSLRTSYDNHASVVRSLCPAAHQHEEGRVPAIDSINPRSCVYQRDNVYQGNWILANTPRYIPNLPQPSSPNTHPNWISDSQPWRGFTPIFGSNEGKVLGPIRVPDAALPYLITRTRDRKYQLDTDLVSRWQFLGAALEKLAGVLEGHLGHLPPLQRPPPPHYSDYASAQWSPHAVFENAKKARNAFSDFTTYISFALSFWRDPNVRYPFANLFQCIRAEDRTLQSFLIDILDSNVGDFRQGTRAGYFTDMFRDGSPWFPYVHIWASAGVPLWIRARDIGFGGKLWFANATEQYIKAVQDWTPPRQVMDRSLETEPASLGGQPPLPPQFTQFTVNGTTMTFPALPSFGFRDGDYVHGMQPNQYFSIRDEDVRRCSRDPTAVVRVRHVDVASWHSGLESVDIYVWECERDFWRRRAVDTHLRKAFFSIFLPQQRRWDPIYHVVDLCPTATDVSWDVSLSVFRAPSTPYNFTYPPHHSSPRQPFSSETSSTLNAHGNDDEWEATSSAPSPRPQYYAPSTASCVSYEADNLPHLDSILKYRIGTIT